MSTRVASLEQSPFGPQIHTPVQDRVFLRGPKESLSDRLRAAVSKVGAVAHDLSERIAEDKAVVAAGLERARATISQAIQERTTTAQKVAHVVSTVVTKENMAKVGHVAQQIGAYALDHKAEIAKKAAPAVATAVGVNIVGGVFAAPVALVREVASGTSNIRHNTSEIKGKNIFVTSASLRRGFGREQRLTDMNVDTIPVSEPQRLLQKISQSKLGKALNGYLHFEEHVTARSVANNSHIRTIHQITNGKSEVEIRDTVNAIGDVRELFDLRSAAVIARLTANPQDRAAISKVHQVVTARIRSFESTAQEESRRDPHSSAYARFIQVERDFKMREHRAYRSTVRSALGVSLGANLVKTALTTTAFFLGGKVLGLHTQNPLEKSKFWSGLVDHARASLHNLGSDIGQSTASALGIDPSHARYVTSPMVDMTHPGVNHDVHSVRGVSEQYASFTKHTAAAGLAMDDQALDGASHQGIVKAHYSLSQDALDRSVVTARSAVSARTDVSMSELVTEKRQLAGHAVPRAASPITAPITDTKLSIDTDTRIPVFVMKVDDQTSLTERIWDMRDNLAVAKALPFISEAKSVRDAFSARDSGTAMWKLIQANHHLMTSEGYARLQAIVEDPENTHASFGTIWAKYHALYPDDHFGGLDNLGYGGNTGMVTFYDRGMIDNTVSASSVAGVSVARVEDTDTIITGHRVLGHARLSRSALPGSSNPTLSMSPSGIGFASEDHVSLLDDGSTGKSVSGYQVVRPPQSTSATGSIIKTDGMYQQVAPPGGRSTGVDTVDGFQKVGKPGGISTGDETTADLTGTSSHGGVTAPPRRMDTPGTGGTTTSIEGYQRVAPPRGGELVSDSPVGRFQEVGRPDTSKLTVVAGTTDGTYQIVSPPKPLEDMSYETVPLPRADSTLVAPSDYTAESRFPWFDKTQKYSATFDSTETIFGFNSKSITVIPMEHVGSGAFNTVTGYFNLLGGLNLELHSGELEKLGVQAFEPIREYLQGGAHSGRLGPVQEAYRAQQLLQAYPYININMGGQQVGGVLTGFHHITISSGGSLIVPDTDADGIIGGSPDITALVGCSRGHVQAIQMLLNAEMEAPSSLAKYFAVLNDDTADGAAVEQAVDKIVREWFINTEKYAEFYKLYGYLLGEKLNIPRMEKDGFFTAGRLVLELNNAMPHGA